MISQIVYSNASDLSISHWFYEDFVREVNPSLPFFPLRKFSAELFRFCPMLQQWSTVHEQAFNQFMAYKLRVPVCGAIMLNEKMDKVNVHLHVS